ncbi:tetratricopeptide repeat protein [Acanthopleuribacter pedis]|uniref:Tetratricopeptide repeat protein n=1 Tax=Acanthopleuribacter pedis TaxID=442870 RepID=A0A8J7Q8X4_9BACT|nr:tetratricopeptide repeat protein [Acanthopleuribacter pedis]MBO1320731.1 tetratricopeptide repeat protein [Acanthopleuribacter pedis]
MQSLIQAMREPVLDLVEQNEKTLHLVTGTDFERTCLLKLVKDMDRGNQCDLYLITEAPFTDADSYLDDLAKRLNDEYLEYLLMTDLEREMTEAAKAFQQPAGPRPVRPAKAPTGPSTKRTGSITPTAPTKRRPPRRNPFAQKKALNNEVVAKRVMDPAKLGPGPKSRRAGADIPKPEAPPVRPRQDRTQPPPLVGAPQPITKATPPIAVDEAALDRQIEALLARHFPEMPDPDMQPEPVDALVARLNPEKAPPPAILADRSVPAAERLAAFIEYGQSCLPNQQDHCFVPVLLPFRIDQPKKWHIFLEDAAKLSTIHAPGSVRLIAAYDVREDQQRRREEAEQNRTVQPLLSALPYSQVQELDLSEARRRQAEEDLIADPNTDPYERHSTLLMLAIRDGVENRQDLALERFDKAYQYFHQQEEHALEAMATIGYGDIYLRNNQWEAARAGYLVGLEPALASNNPIVIYNLSQNLGEACFRMRRYEESERAYALASQACETLKQPHPHLRTLERHGAVCVKLERWAEAREAYERAATIAQEKEETHILEKVMRALKKVYVKLNRKPDWPSFRDHIAGLSKGA